MADNNAPFSVRMESKDKERLLELIQESGRSNKEFMSILLNAYELNKAKLEIPDIAKDIDGLQALTKQINDYYVNIGKRIENIQKSKDIEFTKEIEIYKGKIEALEAENEKISSDFEAIQQNYNNIAADHENIKNQLEQYQENLSDKTLLVEEYKQKNDTLTGLLNDYKKYKAEIEEYKKLLADSQSKNIKLNDTIKEKNFEIDKITAEVAAVKNNKEKIIQELNNKHTAEIQAIKEKSEIQKDKAVLELKKQYQKESQENQRKYNQEIQEYQSKYKELLQEVEKTNKTPRTTTSNRKK